MDVAVIKTKDQVIAFSLYPIGAVGWGKGEKEAISSLNDNIYDYCNWLNKPLPKDASGVIKERYVGEIKDVTFKSDDKSLIKKYSEIAVQTAFSFKSLTDGFCLDEKEKEKVSLLFERLKIADGIIGYSTDVCDSQSLPKIREFIYETYKTAKEIFILAKKRKIGIFNTFYFDVSY